MSALPQIVAPHSPKTVPAEEIWGENWRLLPGDCLEIMPTLAAASVDAIVTDPPYGLSFMGKEWDHGVPGSAFWIEALRVAKPGAYLAASGGTRTYHRLTCAIEDAGWEIGDSLAWLFGSGQPKAKGKLKPGFEPIVLGRKPLDEATLAAQIASTGMGALFIEACRLGGSPMKWEQPRGMGYGGGTDNGPCVSIVNTAGRWPANVILDEDAAADLDAQSGQSKSSGRAFVHRARPEQVAKGAEKARVSFGHEDIGGASRFFYCAKADAVDRRGSKHPTVKPLSLMRWLVRLVTPPGGVVFDPFAGSGTTGEAALEEGFSCILIEREAEYVADIARRMQAVQADITGRLFVPAAVKPVPAPKPVTMGLFAEDTEV